MKPEDIVVSLEMAKKLKDAGWPQEDHCHYWSVPYGQEMDAWVIVPYVTGAGWHTPKDDPPTFKDRSLFFAAPTAEEILRRLPDEAEGRAFGMSYDSAHGSVGYAGSANDDGPIFTDTSLAHATAAMWLYLKEHSLLPTTPDEAHA